MKLKYLYKGIKNFVYLCDYRITAMIGLTYFCQMQCEHCSMANYLKNKKRELTTDELKKLINQFSILKFNGVYFFGGEPLLRSDIYELINFAKKKGLITILDSNGYLITEEVAKKLKESGLKRIGISIDSSDPQVHDQLRGKEGAFRRAVEGIKNCLKEKIEVYLDTYATKENLKNGDLKKIISLGEKLEVNYIRILHPVPMGRWLGKEVMLDDKEREMLESFRRFGFVFIEGDHCSTMRKKLFYLSPYGEVQPCCNIPYAFGNIRKEPLEKILKRMWRHPMYKMKIKGCPLANRKFYEKYISTIKPSTNLPIDLSNYEN